MSLKKVELHYLESDHMDDLDPESRQMIQKAKEAAFSAYAPYSLFKVGASVLLSNGKIVQGSNQENIAYPSGLCAERVAINSAFSHYPDERIVSIAVSSISEFKDDEGVFSPCGACRQVMAEAESRSGRNIKIIVHSPSGQTRIFDGISQLLPFSFTNPALKKKK